MRRARFNVELDGDLAKLIFRYLSTLSRACARAVCKDWHALIPGPIKWSPTSIAFALCDNYQLFEMFTLHWVFIPDFGPYPGTKDVLRHIFKRDNADALNWLAKRPVWGKEHELILDRLIVPILERSSELPRIYHWLLVRSRYAFKDRKSVFWYAIYSMQPNLFVSFLENASIVDTKHIIPFVAPHIPYLHRLAITSDDEKYALRLANLKELTKSYWQVDPQFWSLLCQEIFRTRIGDQRRLAIQMICEAYGQVPDGVCQYLKANGGARIHRALAEWCTCPNKKRK